MTKHIFLCDNCNWKLISNIDDVKLYKLDSDSLSNKKYRCPSCGRAITPRKIKDPQKELEQKKEEEKLNQENKKWIEESIEFKNNFLKEKEHVE
jgi:predicted RNA-binding Zn-ribbon protein involved in translation (DUF1610 family)